MSNSKNKLVFLGDSGVGKTSIIKQWLTKTFSQHQMPTIGTAFIKTSFRVWDEDKAIQVWDTCGQEKFANMAPIYTRDAFAAAIIFDLSVKDSFEHLSKWINTLSDSTIPIVICGNKCDIDEREVSTNEAIKYAMDLGTEFFETSAKTGIGIIEALEYVLLKGFEKKETTKVTLPAVVPHEKLKPSKRTCVC